MRQINLLLMPEDIQLCEKTLVKPVVVKPSELRKKNKEDEEPVDPDTPVDPEDPSEEDDQIADILDYQYEDGFTYTHTPEITQEGKNVSIVYSGQPQDYMPQGDKTATAVADLARLLGAFYHSKNITSIEFGGTEYVWDEEGTLKGSNYKNEGVTLVAAVSQDLAANGLPYQTTLTAGDYTIELTCNAD